MAVGPTRTLQLCCSERRPSRHGISRHNSWLVSKNHQQMCMHHDKRDCQHQMQSINFSP
jgi:hypothetical protein